ncbi:hypothetical protein BGZ94_007506, partial [Podila epigama]
METQIPSTLTQVDPNLFAISKITLHNATASPAITLSVLPSSGLAVRSHSSDHLEYVQNVESVHSSSAHTTSSSPGAPESQVPIAVASSALLLKVRAGEGLKLCFDLEGSLLDLTSTQQNAQFPAEAAIQTSTTSDSAPQSAGMVVSQAEQDDRPQPHTTPEAGNHGDISTPVSSEGASSETQPPHVSPASVNHPSVIYFAEVRSQQELQDLCKEQNFRQQDDNVPSNGKAVYTWDWSYPMKDHLQVDLVGHRGVFAFLQHDLSSGTVHLLSQFSLWITDEASTNVTASVRFSNLQPSTALSKGQHWRRASTPEKYSTSVSRHPSFHGRVTGITASHNSLPSLSDAVAGSANPNTFADPQTGTTPLSSSTSPFPPDSEDGPLFRATVVECENHIRDMKNATKRIIKAAQTVMDTRKSWVAAEEVFIKELESFKPAEPLLTNYLRPFVQKLVEQSETLGQQMRNLLVEPLTRFYGNDLKAAEAHRKAFDDESKEYYTFLSRYMAMKQDNNRKKSEADAKYERKRRHFEIKRFEYWGFLLEMRVGGSKSDEILHHLTNYSEKHCRHIMDLALNVEDLKPGLDTIAAGLLESHKRAAALRKERLERKRELFEAQDDGSATPLSRGVSSTNMLSSQSQSPGNSSRNTEAASVDNSGETIAQKQESTLDAGDAGVSSSGVASSSTVFGTLPISNGSNQKFSGIRDLEHQDLDAGSAHGRRKEGFLFATSRPSMHNNSTVLEKPSINWHKYWCVVSEGHLHEYSHWKKGATMLHNEPINLKISTVRSCRNQDRRFCFEVITPKFRRVYQATSAEDMNSWISVISNAIQSLLNGSRRSSMDQLSSGLPISIHDRRQGSGSSEHGQGKGSTSENRESEHLGTRLLQLMREAHASNSFCAECGAKNPDWCAINLGILICI